MQVFIRFAACALLALCSLAAAAQDKPAWASKGTNALNRSRSNDSYVIEMFNTTDVDRHRLAREAFEPLRMYVRTHHEADASAIRIDSTATAEGMLYTVAYTDMNDGRPHYVQARRIDDYMEFDEYEDNDYHYEYYQLYAIGRPDTQAAFDEFELTRSYNARATAMSIIPGWGQIYKGQTTKGCVIIGVEAVSLATIALGEHKRHYMIEESKKPGAETDSWISKSHSWRNVRNVGIGVAVATYVYNLIDAATSRGARRVNVHRRAGRGMTMAPAFSPDGAAMAFTYTF